MNIPPANPPMMMMFSSTNILHLLLPEYASALALRLRCAPKEASSTCSGDQVARWRPSKMAPRRRRNDAVAAPAITTALFVSFV